MVAVTILHAPVRVQRLSRAIVAVRVALPDNDDAENTRLKLPLNESPVNVVLQFAMLKFSVKPSLGGVVIVAVPVNVPPETVPWNVPDTDPSVTVPLTVLPLCVSDNEIGSVVPDENPAASQNPLKSPAATQLATV